MTSKISSVQHSDFLVKMDALAYEASKSYDPKITAQAVAEFRSEFPEKWRFARRKAFYQSELDALLQQQNKILLLYQTAEPKDFWFLEMELEKLRRQISKCKKAIWHLSHPQDKFDLEYIKAVEIGRILQQHGVKRLYNNSTRAGYVCPLHNEKNGSFVWYKDTNSFYCFGCGKGGDNIHLVQLLEQSDFKEACRYLLGY